MELAKLLQLKAQGNPFFINQILQSLHAEKLIWFDYVIMSWQYEIEKIRFANISDDVVDLLCHQIEMMSPDCVELMQVCEI